MTLKSTVRDLYQHPIGRDFMDKFLLTSSRPAWFYLNPFFKRLPLKIAGWFMSGVRLEDLLPIINDEFDLPDPLTVPSAPAWWKEDIVYTPAGVMDNMDYIQDLGVTTLLLDGSEIWSTQAHIQILEHDMKLIVELDWTDVGSLQAIMQVWLERGVHGFSLRGIDFNFYGYQLHKTLKEIRAFLPDSVLLMGVTRGIGPNGMRLLTDFYRKEFNLVFNLDDSNYAFDSYALRQFYMSRLNFDNGHGWNSLTFPNYKNPIKKSPVKEEYQVPLAKMLAVLQFTLRGTPFMQAGDELGSPFDKKEARKQEIDANSILSFYRDLIILRKSARALAYGALTFLDGKKNDCLCYTRILSLGGENFYIEVNLSPKARVSTAPKGAEFVLGNYGTGTGRLRPYEARIYKH